MLHYFHSLNKFERGRQKWLQQNTVPACLQGLLQSPLPLRSDNAAELDYLVLDLETSGLDPLNDQILSIGMVEISNMSLDMRTAEEVYIKDYGKVNPEAVVINHIVPEMTCNGVSLDLAMESLFRRMTGKVLIAHGMSVEKGFINEYLRSRYDLKQTPFPWLDTLKLEKSLFINQQDSDCNDYTLSGIRSRYGLPDYPAHDALVDAVATGELYFVLLKKIFSTSYPDFGALYQRTHS